MGGDEFLAERFEEQRGHLRAVAYRMLGSVSEADDAVQEGWLRASKADYSEVENLAGWLTTIVSRICLNMLTSRKARREDSMDFHVPDPIISSDEATDPEREGVLADEVGLAMLIVLDALPPAERLAFVLHDMFSVPFDDIAPIVERAPAATRQLASRARKRVQAAAPVIETDKARHREVVEAFRVAARLGDFDALLAVLDPDIVLRLDYGAGGASKLVRGAGFVARQAVTFSQYAQFTRTVLVNGMLGVLTAPGGKPFSVMAFVVRDGRIVEIAILADPERLGRLDMSVLSE